MYSYIASALIVCLLQAEPTTSPASSPADTDETGKPKFMKAETFAGLKLRGIGPALLSGRVVDFAVNPKDRAHYFVAVGSGGVWKTTNAGNTYTPVFDSQPSYSIGCLAMEPDNPSVVWVGSGENN